MLTADEMEKLPEAAEQMMDDLARSILWEIIDRIKNGREITSTTDYLIYRYNAVRGFDKSVKKQIQSAIAATDAEIDRIFDDAMKQAYTRDAELYQNMLSKTLTPYEQNAEVIQYVDQVKRQTKSTMRNITNTSGYMIKVNGQYKMTPAAATLQNALDKVMGPLNLGGKTYEQAIREVVSELVESGLRTVTYASGRTYSVPAAVRMCIMTALTQVRARIVESEMDELEAEYVEVSWHKTARPSHQKWQGRVFHWNRGKTPENEARGALEGQENATEPIQQDTHTLNGTGTKIAEFLMRDHEGAGDTTKERHVVENAIKRCPGKVQKVLADGTIIDIGKIGASQYDYNRDILFVARNASEEDIVHEVGHFVENKMMEDRRVSEYRKDIVGNPSYFDIDEEVYYDASGNEKLIYILRNEKFVSEYQGRVYADAIIDMFDADGSFRDDLLYEFISEPYREYIYNPDNLKEKCPELFELIKETVQ